MRIEMLLSQIAKGIGANWVGPDFTVNAVSIDTRTLSPKDLFVAIEGERTDGHEYLEQACQKGALAVVVNHKKQITVEMPIPVLVVEDTTVALGKMAALWRSKMPAAVIGITGSCGKTSVKEITKSVLEMVGPALASEGSYNNHWGLPLTLLKIKPKHRFAVIEIGTNQPGEINYLTQIAKPNVALITNVGPVHLEGFGTLQGIANEKGDIYRYLQAGDTAILNRDDTFFEHWLEKMPKDVKIITFSTTKTADVMASDIKLKAGCPQFTLSYGSESVSVQLNILGQHQVANGLAAAAVGIAFNVPFAQIADGLSQYSGFKGRLRKLSGKKGIQIIDDSYNANPSSVKAAIEVLAECDGETMLVLGEMAELGVEAAKFHQYIGGYAKQRGIQHFWAVGLDCQHAVTEFGKGGKFFETKERLIQDLVKFMNKSLTILVKGSRRMKMETVVAAIAEEQVQPC
jgi:UDP-N-acetylmuramoyl-tripeptide--D-alanyl-D-alanine ligase